MVERAINAKAAVSAPSRREFLNYALGASVLLAGASTCVGLAWFTQQQRFVGSMNSGLFELALTKLPRPNAEPVFFAEAQAYLSNAGDGLKALLAPCPFERQIVKWSESNQRFECPQCGSKFHLDGSYIEGPATSDLHQATLYVKTARGTVSTPEDGAAVAVDGAESIILDMQHVIHGVARPEVDLYPP